MNTDMRTRALAAHDAHLALLELKKLVDEGAQATHAAELEAVYLAVSARPGAASCTTLRGISVRLNAANLETTLSQMRQELETPASRQGKGLYSSLRGTLWS